MALVDVFLEALVDWVEANAARALGLVVLAFALVIVAISMVFPSASHYAVGMFGNSRWLQFTIVWGILATVIAMFAKGGTFKTLQTILAVVMLALMYAAPACSWVGGLFSGSSQHPAVTATPSSTATQNAVPPPSAPAASGPRFPGAVRFGDWTLPARSVSKSIELDPAAQRVIYSGDGVGKGYKIVCHTLAGSEYEVVPMDELNPRSCTHEWVKNPNFEPIEVHWEIVPK